GAGRAAEEVAEGLSRIAVENMANAIKKISVQRGYDVTEYALNCFGGAGGQHACRVACSLCLKTVFIHPHSGVLSAYGMGLADIRALRTEGIVLPLDAASLPPLLALRDRLTAAAVAEVEGQGVAADAIATHTSAHLRYDGTDTPIPVPFALADFDRMRADFEAAHRQQFGFAFEGKKIVVEAGAEQAVGGGAAIDEPAMAAPSSRLTPAERIRFFSAGAWHEAGV